MRYTTMLLSTEHFPETRKSVVMPYTIVQRTHHTCIVRRSQVESGFSQAASSSAPVYVQCGLHAACTAQCSLVVLAPREWSVVSTAVCL